MIDTLVLAGRNDDGGGLTRRPMFALWRKFTAQQTWRFARCQAVGRDLWRADYRTRQAVPQLEPITAGPSNIRAIVRPQPLPPRVTTEIATRVGSLCARSAAMRFGSTISRDGISRTQLMSPEMMLQWQGSNDFATWTEWRVTNFFSVRNHH